MTRASAERSLTGQGHDTDKPRPEARPRATGGAHCRNDIPPPGSALPGRRIRFPGGPPIPGRLQSPWRGTWAAIHTSLVGMGLSLALGIQEDSHRQRDSSMISESCSASSSSTASSLLQVPIRWSYVESPVLSRPCLTGRSAGFHPWVVLQCRSSP